VFSDLDTLRKELDNLKRILVGSDEGLVEYMERLEELILKSKKLEKTA